MDNKNNSTKRETGKRKVDFNKIKKSIDKGIKGIKKSAKEIKKGLKEATDQLNDFDPMKDFEIDNPMDGFELNLDSGGI